MILEGGQPFLRRVEVIVGPLAEWRGGGDESIGIRLIGDGTPQNFRIRFQVSKHVISTANPSIVSIYNLSPALRKALQNKEARVLLRAGYDNTGMVEVFGGSLLAAVSQRQGPDIVTDLISLAGWGGVVRSAVAKSFSRGISVRDIVIDLAKSIPGVSVDPKLIRIVDANIGSQGWSFAGPANDALDRIARVYGFNWWIDSGIFHAVGDNAALLTGTTPKISSKNGYLLRAEPMLASPFQVKTGVSISSLFNPYVQPGRFVALESEMNPSLNGQYKVHTLSHNGDTHSSQWSTEIQSWVVV